MPEIPAGLVAVTLWEGSKELTWSDGMQELAYGGYDWSPRKVGEYLKVLINPVDPAAPWQIRALYADPEYAWTPFPSLPDSYYQPTDGIVVIELTEEILTQLKSPNYGLIFHGENVILTKVELYREEIDNGGESSTVDNIFVNSGFEDGTTGWMGWWSGYTQSTDEGVNGGTAMLLTLKECTQMYEAQLAQDVAALEPGVYAYEFYAKSEAAPHTMQVYGQELESGNYQGIYGANHEVTAEWTLYTGEIEYTGEPAGITRIGIQFGKADAADAKVWIDNFQFGPKK